MEYHQFPKVDAHVHITDRNSDCIKIAKEHHFHLITINTDAAVFPDQEEQEAVALHFQEQYPQYFSYIASFSMHGWDRPGWLDAVKERIRQSMKKGAIGIKIWKNIGMELRKESGEFLTIDDPFFRPLFQFLTDEKIPVVAHIGEPRNCWLPLEQMTTIRNRTYYTNHPEFHMHLHPEYLPYEAHIVCRDKVLEEHPGLKFIGAHLGSLEWSIDEIADRFERFPDFSVDLSSRLAHIRIQSQKNYGAVRAFFIKYADRLMYGSDISNNPNRMAVDYYNDWLYLSTDSVLPSGEVDGLFKGLQLPDDVLKAIYYDTVMNRYPVLKNRLEKFRQSV